MRSLLFALVASVLCLASACGDRSSAGTLRAGVLSPNGALRGIADGDLVAGEHFELISAPPTSTIESSHPLRVVEFFGYECPHCYRLEPHLVLWNRLRRSVDVEFVRVPAGWSPEQRSYARLYYTLVALGREDLHEAVFDTIHRLGNALYAVDQQVAFQQQLRFAEAHGIGREDFTTTYYSRSVEAAVDEAVKLAKLDHVASIPALVVDERYVTNLGRTKGNEYELLNIVEALVEYEKSRRGAVVGSMPSPAVGAAAALPQPLPLKR